MIDYKIIDLDHYPRKAHFEYFMTLKSPHTGVTAQVDVTELLDFCKKEGHSFYLTFMHLAALAADSVPEFRRRIHMNSDGIAEIREYAECPTSHTEATDNGDYCYCTLHHHSAWNEYIENAVITQKKARESASLDEDNDVEAYYFVSCLPWLHYTDIINPLGGNDDTNPRISWGKFEENFRGRMMMPLSVTVHHGLVDGIHIAAFYREIERLCRELPLS